jgi:hypothetical protein
MDGHAHDDPERAETDAPDHGELSNDAKAVDTETHEVRSADETEAECPPEVEPVRAAINDLAARLRQQARIVRHEPIPFGNDDFVNDMIRAADIDNGRATRGTLAALLVDITNSGRLRDARAHGLKGKRWEWFAHRISGYRKTAAHDLYDLEDYALVILEGCETEQRKVKNAIYRYPTWQKLLQTYRPKPPNDDGEDSDPDESDEDEGLAGGVPTSTQENQQATIDLMAEQLAVATQQREEQETASANERSEFEVERERLKRDIAELTSERDQALQALAQALAEIEHLKSGIAPEPVPEDPPVTDDPVEPATTPKRGPGRPSTKPAGHFAASEAQIELLLAIERGDGPGGHDARTVAATFRKDWIDGNGAMTRLGRTVLALNRPPEESRAARDFSPQARDRNANEEAELLEALRNRTKATPAPLKQAEYLALKLIHNPDVWAKVDPAMKAALLEKQLIRGTDQDPETTPAGREAIERYERPLA